MPARIAAAGENISTRETGDTTCCEASCSMEYCIFLHREGVTAITKTIGRVAGLSKQKIGTISDSVNFEEIGSIEDLETVSEEVIWQNFERLAAFIFEKNDYRVRVNTVKTCHKKRRQYDVIARKSGQTYLVECKKWAGSRYRLSALKKAVEQHKERTTFYYDITSEDAIPVLVTLVEEEIQVYNGVPLVPVLKLNSFLQELERDSDEYSFCDDEDEMAFPDDLLTQSSGFSGTYD